MDSLPPTRNVELMISEANITGPCCSCGATGEVLKCSRCKAVCYCGQDCQKQGWKKHKKTCTAIVKLRQETVAAIDALANCYGGTAALLESPLVRRGHFDIPSDVLILTKEFGSWGYTELQLRAKYVKARWSLAETYAKCGQETLSRLAFRLAVENILDMICLSRNEPASAMESHLLKACIWMVEGDMDQLALNLICYFTRRGQAPSPFPYLDLSINEDIEGISYVADMVEMSRSQMQYFPKMWFHTFMMISLIKVKRLQALLSESRKEEARWNAFMEGTHPRTGASSVVLKIGGVDLVIKNIKEFLLDQSATKRAFLLTMQINDLLENVNERNPKLIPGVFDRKTFPDWSEGEELTETLELVRNAIMTPHGIMEGEEYDRYAARYAANKYGNAWHMDSEYAGALRLFLDTGNVMAEEKNAGNMMTEEEDTSNVKDEDEVTSIVKAEEGDTGNVKAEEKDAGNVMVEKDTFNVMADKKDTGNVKAEKDAGNVMAEKKDAGNVKAEKKDTVNVMTEEKDAGNVKAENDTGNVMAEEKDAGNVKAENDTGNMKAGNVMTEDTSL